MSTPAYHYDDAQAEGFMSALKAEEVYLAGCESFDDFAPRSPRFIDDVYNVKPIHTSRA